MGKRCWRSFFLFCLCTMLWRCQVWLLGLIRCVIPYLLSVESRLSLCWELDCDIFCVEIGGIWWKKSLRVVVCASLNFLWKCDRRLGVFLKETGWSLDWVSVFFCLKLEWNQGVWSRWMMLGRWKNLFMVLLSRCLLQIVSDCWNICKMVKWRWLWILNVF